MIGMIIALALVAPAAVATPAVNSAPTFGPAATAMPVQIDALLAAGQLDTALVLIERSATILPPARLALARADYALASGDLETALADFSALTEEPDLTARVQLGIGLTELRRGQDALAIVALDRAAAADPTLTRAWAARAVAADRQRDWTTADIAYAHALALGPKSAATLANRGYSRLLRARFAESASDSSAALAIDPTLVTAANNLRLARAMLGDYKGAFAGSTKATLTGDLNTVGFAAMSRGDYSMAETFFTRAMRLSSKFDHVAWDNLVYLKELSHRSSDPAAAAR